MAVSLSTAFLRCLYRILSVDIVTTKQPAGSFGKRRYERGYVYEELAMPQTARTYSRLRKAM